MNVRKLIIAVAASAALVAALPASASADEPIECKVVNAVSQKVFGEDILICIDDPPPDPIAVV